MTNRKIEYWVIPPGTDAEFVAHLEEVLERLRAEPFVTSTRSMIVLSRLGS